MLEGGTQVLPLLGLFRNKVDDIIGQVNCDVAVFVNRGYQHAAAAKYLIQKWQMGLESGEGSTIL